MKPLPPRNEEPRALTSAGQADVAGVPVPPEHQGGGAKWMAMSAASSWA